MPRFHKHHRYSPWLGGLTWIYITVSLILGFVVPLLNRWVLRGWISPVDKSTLVSMFSAVASGMITLSGLVFSLMFVLVQFGSATYSPRITRIFAHTHVLHHSLGIFTGTFLYSLMAMRTVGMEGTDDVSGLTIWLGFVWLLGSVAILARLIAVFTTLTVTNVLSALGKAGRIAVGHVYGPYSATTPHAAAESPEAANSKHEEDHGLQIIYEGEPGYVIAYDTDRLVALATQSDTTIKIPYAVGDSLKDGASVAVVHGARAVELRDRIEGAMTLGRERAFQNDPKYAIRLLVDTAIRALSPAINDPTTAVQVLDHIESLLRRLGNANLDIGEVRDSAGTVRLVFRTPTWEDYLQLSLSEIMQYGATSIQVERRLEALLEFLRETVPPERAAALVRFTQHRRSLAARSFEDATFREWAERADRQGIGSQSDGATAGACPVLDR